MLFEKGDVTAKDFWVSKPFEYGLKENGVERLHSKWICAEQKRKFIIVGKNDIFFKRPWWVKLSIQENWNFSWYSRKKWLWKQKENRSVEGSSEVPRKDSYVIGIEQFNWEKPGEIHEKKSLLFVIYAVKDFLKITNYKL